MFEIQVAAIDYNEARVIIVTCVFVAVFNFRAHQRLLFEALTIVIINVTIYDIHSISRAPVVAGNTGASIAACTRRFSAHKVLRGETQHQ